MSSKRAARKQSTRKSSTRGVDSRPPPGVTIVQAPKRMRLAQSGQQPQPQHPHLAAPYTGPFSTGPFATQVQLQLQLPAGSTGASIASTPVPGPGAVALPHPTASVQRSVHAQVLSSEFHAGLGQTAADAEEFLFNQTHEARVALQKQQQATTNTGDTYARHVKNYRKFWEEYQNNCVRENPDWPRVPVLPINATKVAIFLSYETQREKRKRKSADSAEEYQTGTSLGVQSILQTVSALEKERFLMAHHYRHDLSAQTPLRDDPRIKAYEDAAKHNESTRYESSQRLKAAGTSADTYEDKELVQLSNYLLRGSTKSRLVVDIRDRAMLLLSAQLGFRGQNLRDLLLSDIFTSAVPNIAAGENKFFELLSLLTDHGKTNQHGRIDENGALRHKVVEMCGVGALALWLYVLFHEKLGAEHHEIGKSPSITEHC